jgi:ubiquinol-cytochrome c reductase cytochrome b subunit
VLLPTVTFGLLYAWPFIEARITRDRRAHHLLDRPRDAPKRTGLGAAVLSFYGLLFLAGSNDVLSGLIGVAPETLTNVFRVAVFVVPIGTFLLVRRICDDLRRSGAHPGDGMPIEGIERGADGELVERPAVADGALVVPEAGGADLSAPDGGRPPTREPSP